MALFSSAFVFARRHGILVGVVLKADSATKILVIKLADGTEHTFHFVEQTAVHGVDDIGGGAKDAFHGLKEGSQVAVHYTGKGTDDTADEVDKIGKDGMNGTEVAVFHIDRAVKTIAVKTADGVEGTCRLTDSAAKEIGKGAAKGGEKTAHATVYTSEEAGHKVAHFIKWAI